MRATGYFETCARTHAHTRNIIGKDTCQALAEFSVFHFLFTFAFNRHTQQPLHCDNDCDNNVNDHTFHFISRNYFRAHP